MAKTKKPKGKTVEEHVKLGRRGKSLGFGRDQARKKRFPK